MMMGGTDKTSWLEGMEHDEEGAFPEGGTFTELIQGVGKNRGRGHGGQDPVDGRGR